MLSSTSSSSSNTYGGARSLKYIIGLLLALVIVQVALEFACNQLMANQGKNEIRWEKEHNAAKALVHDGKGVLIIGSSILFGIDRDQLQNLMPDWTVRPTVMVGTFFTDWELALRRLFSEDIRPDYVVLIPVQFQIWGDGFRGEYLPLHWMDRADIWDFAQRRHLDLTTTSNLYFASFNRFFALREDLRNALLSNLIPGHKSIIAGATSKHTYTAAEAEGLATERLTRLQSMLAERGSRLIILRYPAPHLEDFPGMLERICDKQHIAYFSPLEALPRDKEFGDIYHLNDHGTSIYTAAVAPALDAKLRQLRGH